MAQITSEALNGFSVPDAALLERFKAIVGFKGYREGVETAPFIHDERGLYEAKTPLVLLPASTKEAADIIKLAHETGTALVPQGGRTGLVGGHLPHKNGVELIISTERLKAIRTLDPIGRTLIAEAGLTLQVAQEAAEAAGLLFPLNIGSKGSCTLGGLIATNAGGTQALAYGVARDLMLGLEVVLPDGRIWNGLKTLKKDNSGYDLRHLFAGSEGTLGLITAISFKLMPHPSGFEAAWIGVDSVEAAVELFHRAQKAAGHGLTGCELMPRLLVDFLTTHYSAMRDPLQTRTPWVVLLDISLFGTQNHVLKPVLEQAFRDGLIADAALAETLAQRDTFWAMRETMSMVQKHEGGSIKHDISVPIAVLAAFVGESLAGLERLIPGCRPVPFGHLGDGNLHFNVTQPQGADKQAFLDRWSEVNAFVHGLVLRYGGSISAEHGVGVLKRDLLPDVKDSVEMDLMRKMKAALDPKGIMNPRKVLQ